MKKIIKGLKPDARSYVLSHGTFAAITAVEGISLSSASRKRLDDMNKRKLSPEDRRAEVIRAYRDAKSRG